MNKTLINKGGFNTEIVRECDLEMWDIKNIDLCISIGGDNTFLKAASFIEDS